MDQVSEVIIQELEDEIEVLMDTLDQAKILMASVGIVLQ